MCVLDAMPLHGMHINVKGQLSGASSLLPHGSRGLEARSFLWPWVLFSAASNTSLKYSVADSESFKKSSFPYKNKHRKFYRSRREAVFLTSVSPSQPSTALCLCSPVHASTGCSLCIRMASWCLFYWEGWKSLSGSGCLAGLASYFDEVT